MGNCTFAKQDEADSITAITKNHFTYFYAIGKGGFGKVWKVEKKKNKEAFAMKEMSKARIISKRSVKSVMNERIILADIQNPFIVNMDCAFQDRENLYLVMDLLTGGDLRYHICNHRKFSEVQTKFFVACIVSALEYIHNKGIIHRDIKPENIVIDHNGYLRVTDFGIARILKPENFQDTSGTPGYMAPEVMCRQNHGIGVDYFAVGVIAYECMFGKRPYFFSSISIKKGDIPHGWTLEAADFINKMIQRKPSKRLGYNGPSEVKEHPWLIKFPWEDLYYKRTGSEFLPPNKEDNFDVKNINEEWKDQDSDKMKENTLLLRRNSYDSSIAAIAGTKLSHISPENNAIISTEEGAKKQPKTINTSNITTKEIAAK